MISKEKEGFSAAAIYVLLFLLLFCFYFDFQKQLQGLKETWVDQGNSSRRMQIVVLDLKSAPFFNILRVQKDNVSSNTYVHYTYAIKNNPKCYRVIAHTSTHMCSGFTASMYP